MKSLLLQKKQKKNQVISIKIEPTDVSVKQAKFSPKNSFGKEQEFFSGLEASGGQNLGSDMPGPSVWSQLDTIKYIELISDPDYKAKLHKHRHQAHVVKALKDELRAQLNEATSKNFTRNQVVCSLFLLDFISRKIN